MFDEKAEPKEVSDIFAGVDKTLETAAPVNSAPAAEPSFASPPASHGALMKILIIGGIVLAVAVVVLVLYKFVFSGSETPTSAAPEVSAVEKPKAPVEKIEPASPSLGGPAEAAPDQAPAPVVEVDADSDGLSDALEKALGTNILKMDTDGDLLYDYDEVKIYETDPLNIDTDGDSYQDGEEVAKGYNPKGQGKLLNFDDAMKGVK